MLNIFQCLILYQETLIKLRKEVFLLSEQINDRVPKDAGILGKTLNYLQSNIGHVHHDRQD